MIATLLFEHDRWYRGSSMKTFCEEYVMPTLL